MIGFIIGALIASTVFGWIYVFKEFKGTKKKPEKIELNAFEWERGDVIYLQGGIYSNRLFFDSYSGNKFIFSLEEKTNLALTEWNGYQFVDSDGATYNFVENQSLKERKNKNEILTIRQNYEIFAESLSEIKQMDELNYDTKKETLDSTN